MRSARRDNGRELSDEAHELVLFAVNDGDLYRQSAQPIMENLARRLRKGTLDPELAVKAWQYHAERAARAYGREHLTGSEWQRVFPPAVRREAAREFARYYMEEIRDKAGITQQDRARRSSRRDALPTTPAGARAYKNRIAAMMRRYPGGGAKRRSPRRRSR